MRLVTFRDSKRLEPAVIVGNQLLSLSAAQAWWRSTRGGEVPTFDSILGYLQAGRKATQWVEALLNEVAAKKVPEAFEGSKLLRPLSEGLLVSPIPRPPTMRDGYAFRQHVVTARRNRGLEMIPEFDQFPVFYFTNPEGVMGPGELRVQPMQLERLDFELEVAIVVGKTCTNLTVDNADSVIAGFTIMNDWSARAVQMEEMKLSLGPAKGKDFATSLGPWLVTPDELASRTTKSPKGNVYDLSMKAVVNGIQVSTGNAKDMTWTFAEILARASYGVTLRAGDVIGSGTCGTGCFLELNGSKITDNQWLKPGDTVVLSIEGLGDLSNTIATANEDTFIEE